MAKVLDSFDWGANKGGAKAKYPWDEWFDGRIWQLEKGVDYNIKSETLRISVQKKANLKQLKIRTSTTATTLTLQVIGKKDAQ